MAAPHTPSDIGLEKQRRRDALALQSDRFDRIAVREIEQRIDQEVERLGATVISCFWPLPDEPDLRRWMVQAHAVGLQILLPRVESRDAPLLFDRWSPQDGTIAGAFGTRSARAGSDRLDLRPELILVPVVGFDRACRRLGRGGGYYDRTLARYPGVPSIGVALSTRECGQVPSETHDRACDLIVTDRETLRRPDREC